MHTDAVGERVTASDLEGVALFAGLEPAVFSTVTDLARWEQRDAGEAIVRQGQPGDVVYVMVDGEADVEIDGTLIDPGILPGECVGELAVLERVPRAATVTATIASRLLAFEADDFHRIVEASPMLRDRLTLALTQRLRAVSHSWSRMAANVDLLLDACLALQEDASADRNEAIAQAAALLRELSDTGSASPDALERLTPAERRVAHLVADGLSNTAVAEQLSISRHTVESHLKHIYRKLDITTRVSLARCVLRSG